jgi:hypothetical protein
MHRNALHDPQIRPEAETQLVVSNLLTGLPSRVLEYVVLPAKVDLFLRRKDMVG